MTRRSVEEVRAEISDPRALCAALGIEPSRTERKKWRCPHHGGGSLSVTRGPNGGVRARCFGCDFSGDAFGLIAEVRGLDLTRDFPVVLREAAALAGFQAETSWSAPPTPKERAYPPQHEVASLLDECTATVDDQDAAAHLHGRGIEPWLVDELGLARVVPQGAKLPPWASFCGRPWTETGHRLLLPVVDARGEVRSVRAWRLADGNTPKRLPPAGHRAAGLILACPFARGLLGGLTCEFAEVPSIVITEGEPDFLTWATSFSDANEAAPVVLGIVAGAWTAEFAARIPSGTRVILRTHHDTAGDRYAADIATSLRSCAVVRSRPTAEVAA
jgi:hypothetical protein